MVGSRGNAPEAARQATVCRRLSACSFPRNPATLDALNLSILRGRCPVSDTDRTVAALLAAALIDKHIVDDGATLAEKAERAVELYLACFQAIRTAEAQSDRIEARRAPSTP